MVSKCFYRHPFTMVELMGVMAIIAILAGLGVKGMQFASQASSEAATKANMEKIKIILENFKKVKGYYPQQKNELGQKMNRDQNGILQFEVGNGDSVNSITEGELDKVIPNYTELINSKVIKKTSTGNIIFYDGYGNYFYYRCPGYYNWKSYDLVSCGPDNYLIYTAGSDDSNPAQFGNSYYDDNNGRGNVDNITNWQ